VQQGPSSTDKTEHPKERREEREKTTETQQTSNMRTTQETSGVMESRAEQTIQEGLTSAGAEEEESKVEDRQNNTMTGNQ